MRSTRERRGRVASMQGSRVKPPFQRPRCASRSFRDRAQVPFFSLSFGRSDHYRRNARALRRIALMRIHLARAGRRRSSGWPSEAAAGHIGGSVRYLGVRRPLGEASEEAALLAGMARQPAAGGSTRARLACGVGDVNGVMC